jgi:hypothetical protein
VIVLVPTKPIPGSSVAAKEPDAPVGETEVIVIVPLPNAMPAVHSPVPASHVRVVTEIRFGADGVLMVPVPTWWTPIVACDVIVTPVPSWIDVAPNPKLGPAVPTPGT